MKGREPLYLNFCSLIHKNAWAFNKWVDKSTEELFRSYVYRFAIVRNSYTQAVSVDFSCVTQFFSEEYNILI